MNNNLDTKALPLVITIIIFAIGILFTLIQMNSGRTEVLEGRIYEIKDDTGEIKTDVGIMQGNIKTIMEAIVELKTITYESNGKQN